MSDRQPIHIWYLVHTGVDDDIVSEKYVAQFPDFQARYGLSGIEISEKRFFKLLAIAKKLSKQHNIPVKFSGQLGEDEVTYDLSNLQNRLSAGHKGLYV